ncbi:MAG: tetratricopeptide repeat protein [Bacteroidales bacterium]|nr:MAG: tetratricopeptide repeat protein [Bacteroidales bacterium]
MKRIFIGLLLIVSITFTYAQKSKISSALNYVTSGQLDKAKEAIEAAAVHEKSKDLPRMFYAKGKVLQAVGETDNEEFMNLYEDPLVQAYNFYMEAIERDEKGKMEKLINLAMPLLANDFISLGITKFQEGDFEKALEAFEYNLEIGKMPFYGGAIDTSIIFNAGLSAYNAKINDKAIEHFTKVKDLEYGDFTLYILLKNTYIAEDDSASALVVLQEGFEKYPENESLLIELINFYLMQGGEDAAQQALDYIAMAKEKDSDNASFYHAEGILYDKMGDVEKSIVSYEEALKLNPDYFDSNYNLGAHYFNRGVNKVNECNEILDNVEYDKCKTEADEIFKVALPYMEKAHELNSTDKSTMETLKLLYYRMQMMDKHDAMDQKLRDVQ